MIDRTDPDELTSRTTDPDDQSERGSTDIEPISGQPGSRVGQCRQLRRSQVSLFPFALIVIGIGIILLMTPDALTNTSPFVIGFGTALIGLTLTLRFLLNRREERGIGTLGITILFTALGVAGIEAVTSTLFTSAQIAAIALMAAGLSVWLTAALAISAARGSTAGTGLLGAALIIMGGLALAVTSSLIDLSGLPLIDRLRGGWITYWPIAAVIAAILLLPFAVRRRN